MSLLAEPVQWTGEVWVDPEQGLLRHTTAPRETWVWLSPSRLVMRDTDGIREVDLSRYPQAGMGIGLLFSLLRGDGPALDEQFDATLASTDTSWTLTLVPKKRQLKRIMAQAVVSGSGGVVQSIHMEEPGGDSRMIELLPPPESTVIPSFEAVVRAK